MPWRVSTHGRPDGTDDYIRHLTKRRQMNDLFEKRIRAAAIAGWWVVLIGYASLTAIWLVYLALVAARPNWLLAMWGQDIGWDFVQTVSLGLMGVFKVFLWLLLLAALWLTLWARQLRKLEGIK